MQSAVNPIPEFKHSYEAAKGRLATALRVIRELLVRDPAAAEEIARNVIAQMESVVPAEQLSQLKEKFGMQPSYNELPAPKGEGIYADSYPET